MTSKIETRAVSTKIVDLRGWWDGSFPFDHSGFEISTTFSGNESNGYTSWESTNTVCVRLALDEIEAFLKAPFDFIREAKKDPARSSRVDLLGEYDHDDREYRRLSHYSAALQPDFGAAVKALRDGLVADLPGLFAQLREQVEAWQESSRQGAHGVYAASRHQAMRTMDAGSRGGYLAREAATCRSSVGRNADEVQAFLAKVDALYEALCAVYVQPMLDAMVEKCRAVA